MNINKTLKKGNLLKHKLADCIPILPWMHIVMSPVIQFDKSIHPMVLFKKNSHLRIHKYYVLSYIMRESPVETINMGRGEWEVVIRPSLHP